jgi:hypothetical protein
MYWKLCTVGLIALAGCAKTPENSNTSNPANAAGATDSTQNGSVAAHAYTLSVPNMT